MDERTADDPLRVGVVGCGFIGRTVGGDFDDSPRASVTAVADVAERPREETGDHLGVPPTARYADFGAMLDDEAVDAVLVATPHTLHYDQVVAAFDRGAHVFCEKPLATDLDEAAALVERAESDDRVLVVDYPRRFDPVYRRVRDRWASGEGDPTLVTAEIAQNWFPRFEGTWRADPELGGGGILYDTGSHLLDAVLWTTGLTPTAVTAEMSFAAEGVETRAVLTVRFEGDATASVAVNGEAPFDSDRGVREHVRGWDGRGGVYVDGHGWTERTLTVVDRGNASRSPRVDRSEGRTRIEAFLDAVVDGAPVPVPARDAARVTALTEAAYEAAETGDPTAVPTW